MECVPSHCQMSLLPSDSYLSNDVANLEVCVPLDLEVCLMLHFNSFIDRLTLKDVPLLPSVLVCVFVNLTSIARTNQCI